jgi:hypothetical protein
MDLESYWRRLRPPRPPESKEKQPREWNLREALIRAAVKCDQEMKDRFPTYDPVVVSRVATAAVQAFLEAWYDELHAGDTVSLIGVVLEGADLTVEELKAFVRALPTSLLKRICDFPTPTASGTQALLALEHEYRRHLAPEYQLSRDPNDGRLVVSFAPPALLGQVVTFKLEESFEGATPLPQPLDLPP